MQTSSSRKRPGTQAEGGEPETETMERDVVQPGADPQPLPAGNSKNVRPRARPLKRAKPQTHVTSDSLPQPQSTSQIQPAASGAPAIRVMESVHASPPTQDEDTLRLPQKRPNPTLHQLNHTDKRQEVLGEVQSEEVAETMNRSADVDLAAKGNYILMTLQRLCYSDILAPGAESSLPDNIGIDPALGGQVKMPPVAQSVAGIKAHARPKKTQPTRVKKLTAPTRIQPKRSSRS